MASTHNFPTKTLKINAQRSRVAQASFQATEVRAMTSNIKVNDQIGA